MVVANSQFAHLLVALKDGDCGRFVSHVLIRLFGPEPDDFGQIH